MDVRVIWTVEDKPDIPSRLVMAFQRTPYSHVALHVGNDIIHAVGKGVCREPIADFMKDHKIVAAKDVALRCSQEAFEARIAGELGKEYSQAQLLRIAMGLKKLSFGNNDDSKRICSEFVGIILRDYSSYSVELSGDMDTVTPKCLFKMIFGKDF